MVLVQILAYGKVNDTRVRKKSARAAAKAERERQAALQACTTTIDGHVSESDNPQNTTFPQYTKNAMNGNSPTAHDECAGQRSKEDKHIEDSTTEPSSEEEIIL